MILRPVPPFRLDLPCGPCAAVRVTRSTVGMARPTAALWFWGIDLLNCCAPGRPIYKAALDRDCDTGVSDATREDAFPRHD